MGLHQRRLLLWPAHWLGAGLAAALVLSGETALAKKGEHSVYIREAAGRFCIPESWIEAVIGRESIGNARATSEKGAMSLMQIMPETWAILRKRHALGHNPYHPRDNILAGTAYIRELYNQFGAPDFLAAYNMGPVRFARDSKAKRPLPRETRYFLKNLSPVVTDNPPPPCILDPAFGP